MSSNLERSTILVDLGNEQNHSECSSVNSIRYFIEKELGFVTVVKGLGEIISATAQLSPNRESGHPVFGEFRLSQLDDGRCFVDGYTSEFKPKEQHYSGYYSLAIHEYGNLEEDDLSSIGEPLVIIKEDTFDEKKRTINLAVSKAFNDCKLSSIIGRSLAITRFVAAPISSMEILCASVIARASKTASNDKKICSCSGKTIWEERLERIRND